MSSNKEIETKDWRKDPRFQKFVVPRPLETIGLNLEDIDAWTSPILSSRMLAQYPLDRIVCDMSTDGQKHQHIHHINSTYPVTPMFRPVIGLLNQTNCLLHYVLDNLIWISKGEEDSSKSISLTDIKQTLDENTKFLELKFREILAQEKESSISRKELLNELHKIHDKINDPDLFSFAKQQFEQILSALQEQEGSSRKDREIEILRKENIQLRDQLKLSTDLEKLASQNTEDVGHILKELESIKIKTDKL